MNKTAISNIMHIASELKNSEPKLAHGIVENLKGLIKESRVATSKISGALADKLGYLKAIKDAGKKIENLKEPDEIEDEIEALIESLTAEQEKQEKKEKTASVNIATLVRVAHTYPATRPILLPIIAAKTKKKPAKKAGKKPAVTSSKKKPAKKAGKKPAVTGSKKKPAKKPDFLTGKASKKGSRRKASALDITVTDSQW